MFLKDSFIYTIPTIVSRGLSFFLVPLYTRVLAPGDYGALDLLLAFATLANLSVALEISQGLSIYYTEAKTKSEKSRFASSAFWFSFGAYGTFLIVGLFFSAPLSNFLLNTSGLEKYFQLALLYIFVNGLNTLVHSQFRWQHLPKLYATGSLIQLVATTGVAIVLTYFLSWGLAGVLWGMIAGCAAGLCFGLSRLRGDTFGLKASWPAIRLMVLFSIPLVPSSISSYLNFWVDRILINHFLSLNEVGLYGIGYRFASVTALATVGFNAALTPYIYKFYQLPETPQKIESIFRIFISIALTLYLGMGLFSEEIVRLMTTGAYHSAAHLPVLIIPGVLMGSMYLFFPGIAIAKKTYILMWINIAGAFVNFVLNWFLIQHFGIFGAAFSTTFSGFVVLAIQYRISQKLYFIPFNWSQVSICLAGVVAIIFFSKFVIHTVGWLSFFKIPLLALLPVLLVGTGLVKRSEVTDTLRLFSWKAKT